MTSVSDTRTVAPHGPVRVAPIARSGTRATHVFDASRTARRAPVRSLLEDVRDHDEAVVERVAAIETYELRHRILGRGDSPAAAAVADDGEPDSGHFVHRMDGLVVATGTIRRRPPPEHNGPGWQIRGMAVEPDQRGKGLGSAILAALIDHAIAHDGGSIWCHARIRARTLYERYGFRGEGDPLEDPVAGTQLLMTRDTIT